MHALPLEGWRVVSAEKWEPQQWQEAKLGLVEAANELHNVAELLSDWHDILSEQKVGVNLGTLRHRPKRLERLVSKLRDLATRMKGGGS